MTVRELLDVAQFDYNELTIDDGYSIHNYEDKFKDREVDYFTIDNRSNPCAIYIELYIKVKE